MKQKFTVLFDLDGTLVDTAPDLMLAHNHVMKKFGYPTKSLDDLKSSVGKGAGAMIGRSIWSQAKKELTSINEKVKSDMTDEFISYYGKNILKESVLINGTKDFLHHTLLSTVDYNQNYPLILSLFFYEMFNESL